MIIGKDGNTSERNETDTYHFLRILVVLFFLPVMLIFQSGCTVLLAPREGEPPENDVPWWWTEPGTPQSLAEDLAASWINGNASMYERLLDENVFSFVPDPLDTTGMGDKFKSWDFARESSFAEQVLLTTGIEVQLAVPSNPDLADDPGAYGETDIYRDYTLVIPGNRWAPDAEHSACGMMVLHLTEDSSGLWSIAMWEDIRTEATVSGDWGLVRTDY
jgi:hypothetical protein